MIKGESLALLGIIFATECLVDSLIRRCECDEDNECRNQALDSVGRCAVDCGSLLTSLGGDTQDMVNCFGDQRPAIQAEDLCFRRKINYQCDSSSGSISVSEENFDNLEFTFDVPTKPTVGPIMQEIYNNLHLIFKYNYCIRSCYKNVTTACYKSKSCGYDLPDRKILVTFAKACIGAHSLFYIEQVQACHCLLHKLHLTKLVGTCLHIGNPFLKEAEHF